MNTSQGSQLNKSSQKKYKIQLKQVNNDKRQQNNFDEQEGMAYNQTSKNIKVKGLNTQEKFTLQTKWEQINSQRDESIELIQKAPENVEMNQEDYNFPRQTNVLKITKNSSIQQKHVKFSKRNNKKQQSSITEVKINQQFGGSQKILPQKLLRENQVETSRNKRQLSIQEERRSRNITNLMFKKLQSDKEKIEERKKLVEELSKPYDYANKSSLSIQSEDYLSKKRQEKCSKPCRRKRRQSISFKTESKAKSAQDREKLTQDFRQDQYSLHNKLFKQKFKDRGRTISKVEQTKLKNQEIFSTLMLLSKEINQDQLKDPSFLTVVLILYAALIQPLVMFGDQVSDILFSNLEDNQDYRDVLQFFILLPYFSGLINMYYYIFAYEESSIPEKRFLRWMQSKCPRLWGNPIKKLQFLVIFLLLEFMILESLQQITTKDDDAQLLEVYFYIVQLIGLAIFLLPFVLTSLLSWSRVIRIFDFEIKQMPAGFKGLLEKCNGLQLFSDKNQHGNSTVVHHEFIYQSIAIELFCEDLPQCILQFYINWSVNGNTFGQWGYIQTISFLLTCYGLYSRVLQISTLYDESKYLGNQHDRNLGFLEEFRNLCNESLYAFKESTGDNETKIKQTEEELEYTHIRQGAVKKVRDEKLIKTQLENIELMSNMKDVTSILSKLNDQLTYTYNTQRNSNLKRLIIKNLTEVLIKFIEMNRFQHETNHKQLQIDSYTIDNDIELIEELSKSINNYQDNLKTVKIECVKLSKNHKLKCSIIDASKKSCHLKGKCKICESQPFFNCLTCKYNDAWLFNDKQDICVQCRFTCHKDHVVKYIGVSKKQCRCGSTHNQCSFRKQFNQYAKKYDRKETQSDEQFKICKIINQTKKEKLSKKYRKQSQFVMEECQGAISEILQDQILRNGLLFYIAIPYRLIQSIIYLARVDEMFEMFFQVTEREQWEEHKIYTFIVIVGMLYFLTNLYTILYPLILIKKYNMLNICAHSKTQAQNSTWVHQILVAITFIRDNFWLILYCIFYTFHYFTEYFTELIHRNIQTDWELRVHEHFNHQEFLIRYFQVYFSLYIEYLFLIFFIVYKNNHGVCDINKISKKINKFDIQYKNIWKQKSNFKNWNIAYYLIFFIAHLFWLISYINAVRELTQFLEFKLIFNVLCFFLTMTYGIYYLKKKCKIINEEVSSYEDVQRLSKQEKSEKQQFIFVYLSLYFFRIIIHLIVLTQSDVEKNQYFIFGLFIIGEFFLIMIPLTYFELQHTSIQEQLIKNINKQSQSKTTTRKTAIHRYHKAKNKIKITKILQEEFVEIRRKRRKLKLKRKFKIMVSVIGKVMVLYKKQKMNKMRKNLKSQVHEVIYFWNKTAVKNDNVVSLWELSK